MANRQTGGTRRTGFNPTAYMGVEPVSPPNLVRLQRAPTSRDFNFNLGDIWMVEDPTEVWMLADKPQNVADWILIYPQAGGGGIAIIRTPEGDVVGDPDDVVNFNDGENTNVSKIDNNTLAYNLNRTIEWPPTNAAGTEGVIYLDGESFMHNYGTAGNASGNIFYGINAGNFSLTGAFNTGIGNDSLSNITTGSSNTCIGATTGAALTSGSDCILVGADAGLGITPGTNFALLIGNAGTGIDSNTIRIGTETLHTTAYVSGITGVTVSGTVSPNKVVNIDTDGQLGEVEFTSSGATVTITQPSNGVINFEAAGGGGGGGGNPFAFSYVQDTTVSGIPNGTVYTMGTQQALIPIFDLGNVFYAGSGVGAPAFFQAPVTGVYYLEFYVTTNGAFNVEATIITPFNVYRSLIGSGVQLNQGICTVVVSLNMGNQVFFSTKANTSGNPNYSVSGNGTLNFTRIDGFLISQGASGGNFSQPFLGIQQVDTPIGQVPGFFALGALAPMVEQYDIGNNFDAGDGAGTPASFTAPETGIYQFSATYSVSGVSRSSQIKINGIVSLNMINSGQTATNSYVLSTQVALTIGDIVTWEISISSNVASIIASDRTFVSGYRIA